MDPALLLSLAKEALLLMVLASVPPIAASLVTGVVMSIFQATTQIQESTLSVVPRLCAAVLALALFGPWIGGQLATFAAKVLMALPAASQ
jgi:flagellar biosynthesis protein FliQ